MIILTKIKKGEPLPFHTHKNDDELLKEQNDIIKKNLMAREILNSLRSQQGGNPLSEEDSHLLCEVLPGLQNPLSHEKSPYEKPIVFRSIKSDDLEKMMFSVPWTVISVADGGHCWTYVRNYEDPDLVDLIDDARIEKGRISVKDLHEKLKHTKPSAYFYGPTFAEVFQN